MVGVKVFVGVTVDVLVGVKVFVGVTVDVLVGVKVFVGVTVVVLVGVKVGVLVGVLVGVSVCIGVSVGVLVGVTVFVGVWVGVLDGRGTKQISYNSTPPEEPNLITPNEHSPQTYSTFSGSDIGITTVSGVKLPQGIYTNSDIPELPKPPDNLYLPHPTQLIIVFDVTGRPPHSCVILK